MASSFDPAFGGGDVVDAGGVTLDTLPGVCVTGFVGELALPADGERRVGDDIPTGLTFRDCVSPAFFNSMSMALKCLSMARACSSALMLGSTGLDASPLTGVISTLPKLRLFPPIL